MLYPHNFRYASTRFAITTLIVITLCMLLTGCSTVTMSTTPCDNCAVGSGTQGVQVFVQPDAGDQVITNAIAEAEKSVWVKMYLLTDKHIIQALEEAAHRGLDVQVMLEMHPFGGGGSSPTETLDRLRAAGVNAQPSSPDFALTHEKSMVIDGNTAYIMTCNFTLSALGEGNHLKNREYGIIDSNPQDVQAVVNIFNADWSRTPAQFNNPNLVVSPINSRNTFITLINNAHNSLLIEAELMNDDAIEQALVYAVKRGIHVQVILPAPSSSSDGGTGDSASAGITIIKNGGVQVKMSTQLYMHAKIFVVDGQKAFVGSVNISTASLDSNRELGIIVSDQNVLATLQQTFQQDWSDSYAA